MNTRDIIAALKKLDPENDEHWTIDGAPRVDATEEVSGLVGITRELLTEAAPLFSRASLELPDLEAERAEAERLKAEAEELEKRAAEAKKVAQKAHDAIQAKDKQIRDSHTLTRQNQQWIESQNKAQQDRIDNQKKINAALEAAGDQAGPYPLEVNERARIRSKRRNIILPPQR